jgi:hypothetical protein
MEEWLHMGVYELQSQFSGTFRYIEYSQHADI